MAWTNIGTIASGKSTTSGTTVAGTVGGSGAAIGDVLVAYCAKDNASTVDAATSEFSSIADTQGNTWTKAREYCNGQGFANAGATVAIFYCHVTTAIPAADTITVTISDARTAKAFSVEQFRPWGGSTISVAGGSDLANDGADPGSMSVGGLASNEYLFARAIASESSDATALTVTANHTAIASEQIADTGISASSMAVRGEWRIVTATSDTSDPTLFSADHASVMVAFLETTTRIPGSLMMMGVGT